MSPPPTSGGFLGEVIGRHETPLTFVDSDIHVDIEVGVGEAEGAAFELRVMLNAHRSSPGDAPFSLVGSGGGHRMCLPRYEDIVDDGLVTRPTMRPASGVRDPRAGAGGGGATARSDACSYEGDTVLVDAMVVPTVAVTDLDHAKRFFGDQVGLTLLEETPFALRFGAGRGTQLSIRKGQPNVGQTVAHFEVDDIEAVIGELTSRGVEFQEYETPKTVDFIAQIGPARGAWFADADGNVFGVREGPVPGSR